MKPDRRAVLAGTGALAAAGPVSAAPPPAVTRILARYLAQARVGDIPAKVCREGCRTLLNYVGVAVGGSRHETVTRALAALTPFSGKPEAAILGRREKLDILNASLVGGITPAPVVAVPTSTGYGAALEGVTALLAMHASCAAGVAVVGIDNGYGAACAVARMLP